MYNPLLNYKQNSFLKIGIPIFLVVFLLISCNINSSEHENKSDIFPSFRTITNIHQISMNKAYRNFEPDKTVKNLEDGIKYVRDFNEKSILESFSLSDVQRNLLKKGMDETKNFLVEINYPYANYSIGAKQLSLFDIQNVVIADLLKHETINIDDAKILRRLIDSFQKAEVQQISVFALDDTLSTLENEFKSIVHQTETNYGYITGAVLAVAKESYNWWLNNPGAIQVNSIKTTNKIDNKIQAIPLVVANDIAGALVGAGIAVSGQMIINGEVDWGIVGWSAVSGAVIGSTGVVGKIGKWLSNLF